MGAAGMCRCWSGVALTLLLLAGHLSGADGHWQAAATGLPADIPKYTTKQFFKVNGTLSEDLRNLIPGSCTFAHASPAHMWDTPSNTLADTFAKKQSWSQYVIYIADQARAPDTGIGCSTDALDKCTMYFEFGPYPLIDSSVAQAYGTWMGVASTNPTTLGRSVNAFGGHWLSYEPRFSGTGKAINAYKVSLGKTAGWLTASSHVEDMSSQLAGSLHGLCETLNSWTPPRITTPPGEK